MNDCGIKTVGEIYQNNVPAFYRKGWEEATDIQSHPKRETGIVSSLQKTGHEHYFVKIWREVGNMKCPERLSEADTLDSKRSNLTLKEPICTSCLDTEDHSRTVYFQQFLLPVILCCVWVLWAG